RLDPQPADPGPARRREVRQPLARARVPGRGVPGALRGSLPAGRAARPLPRPQAARPRAGIEARLGLRAQAAPPDRALLRPLHAGDLGLRLRPPRRRPRPRPRLPRGLSDRRMSRAESAGDLALVLHSHMPYVEGFGTYPFGEEWLFDAVIRSYLPVL